MNTCCNGCVKDKYVGILLGGCIGDILGAQNENMTFDAIRSSASSIKTTFAKNGGYTDDTELTLILCRHLVSNNLDIDTDALHQDYSDTVKYSQRGYSTRTRSVFNCYNKFTLPGTAPTNGSIMRISPLSFVHHLSDSDLRRKIRSAVYCTHGDNKDAVDVCLVYVKLLKLLMYNGSVSIDLVFKLLLEEISKLKNGKFYAIVKLVSLTYSSLTTVENITQHLFGYNMFQINAIDCFACSMFCFAQSYSNPLNALVNAANMGGDTDTIAKLVGELIGAKFGSSWIPAKFATHEAKDELSKLATTMWSMRFRDDDTVAAAVAAVATSAVAKR